MPVKDNIRHGKAARGDSGKINGFPMIYTIKDGETIAPGHFVDLEKTARTGTITTSKFSMKRYSGGNSDKAVEDSIDQGQILWSQNQMYPYSSKLSYTQKNIKLMQYNSDYTLMMYCKNGGIYYTFISSNAYSIYFSSETQLISSTISDNMVFDVVRRDNGELMVVYAIDNGSNTKISIIPCAFKTSGNSISIQKYSAREYSIEEAIPSGSEEIKLDIAKIDNKERFTIVLSINKTRYMYMGTFDNTTIGYTLNYCNYANSVQGLYYGTLTSNNQSLSGEMTGLPNGKYLELVPGTSGTIGVLSLNFSISSTSNTLVSGESNKISVHDLFNHSYLYKEETNNRCYILVYGRGGVKMVYYNPNASGDTLTEVSTFTFPTDIKAQEVKLIVDGSRIFAFFLDGNYRVGMYYLDMDSSYNITAHDKYTISAAGTSTFNVSKIKYTNQYLLTWVEKVSGQSPKGIVQTALFTLADLSYKYKASRSYSTPFDAICSANYGTTIGAIIPRKTNIS